MADNSITVVGNVTRDPELRFANSGTTIAKFSVAVSRKRGDTEVTSFFDVSCFGSLAQNVASSLTKGIRVIVEGTLEQRTWETETGDKRSKIEILANSVGTELRWAKATVERNPRPEGGSSDRPAPRAAEPSYNNFDEEPF